MKNIHLVEHPIVRTYITKLRDKNFESEMFRNYSKLVSYLLIADALEDLQLEPETVTTQTEGVYKGHKIKEKIRIFGVLREGISIMNAAMDLLPGAEFDLVGVKRNDDDPFNSKAVIYLDKFKDLPKSTNRVILTDQMLATGGTILVLLESLINNNNFKGKVQIISMIAAKIGADTILKNFPNVHIYCAGFDTMKGSGVNSKGYIYPGLGDATDRYFGMPADLDHVK